MTADWLADTRTSYDTVAVSYAERLRDALGGEPYSSGLALFAELVHAPATARWPTWAAGPDTYRAPADRRVSTPSASTFHRR